MLDQFGKYIAIMCVVVLCKCAAVVSRRTSFGDGGDSLYVYRLCSGVPEMLHPVSEGFVVVLQNFFKA